MTDADYAAQKARVLAMATRWLKPLGLLWWRVEHQWSREPLRTSAEDKAENWVCLARTRAKWQYLHVAFEWNLPAIADLTDERLETTFVHECVHALVAEMREWATEHEDGGVILHEERVVTMLASAFLWTRQAGEDDALAILAQKE